MISLYLKIIIIGYFLIYFFFLYKVRWKSIETEF